MLPYYFVVILSRRKKERKKNVNRHSLKSESMAVSCAILKFPFWICILCAHIFSRFPNEMRLPIFGIAGIFSLYSHTIHNFIFAPSTFFFLLLFPCFSHFHNSSHHLYRVTHTEKRTHAVFSLRLSHALSLCMCICICESRAVRTSIY